MAARLAFHSVDYLCRIANERHYSVFESLRRVRTSDSRMRSAKGRRVALETVTLAAVLRLTMRVTASVHCQSGTLSSLNDANRTTE